MGEIKVLLVNLKEEDYEVYKEDSIMQMIAERIMDTEILESRTVNETERV